MTKDDEIRKLAYNIYKKRNRQHGSEIEDWLKAENAFVWKERLFKFLRHPIFLLFISGIAIWFIQQNYLRNEKMLDKKYEILEEMSSIHADYYQKLWNYFYGKQDKEGVGNMREYRREIQSTVARGVSVNTELPILFDNKEISDNWNKFMKTYHDTWYKLTREEVSGQKLNEELNKADPYITKVVQYSYSELGKGQEKEGKETFKSSEIPSHSMQESLVSGDAGIASGSVVK